MSAMASQITSLEIVYLTVYTDTDQRKLQSSVSLAFVRGIPVNSPHKGPVTRKMFPFDDVIMYDEAMTANSTDACAIQRHCIAVRKKYRRSDTCYITNCHWDCDLIWMNGERGSIREVFWSWTLANVRTIKQGPEANSQNRPCSNHPHLA